MGDIIKITRIDDFSAVLRMKQEWDHLLSAMDCKTLFLTLEWLKVYWETYKSGAKIFCFIAEDSQQWVGCIPLIDKRTGILDLNTQIIGQLGSGVADYLIPIIRKGREKEVLPLLLDKVRELASKNALLIFRNIPEDSFSNVILQAELLKRGWIYNKQAGGCPIVDLKDKSFEQVQHSWDRRHFNDIKRQIKRLSQQGEISLKIFNKKEEALKHFNNFLKMYEQRWQYAGFANPLNKDKLKNYYYNLVCNLSDKFLHFSALCLNGKPISYHIGFLYEKYFYYYKPVYACEYENFSPGKIHVAFLMQEGCREQWKAFDFLQGDEAYKFKWTKQIMKTCSYVVTFQNAGIKYKWHVGGKIKAYKMLGQLYRKIRMFKQIIRDKLLK